jgi:uncharacterized protein YjbI with pentapeptide repeats
MGEADLSEADLSGANLSKANMSGAILSGANLSGAKYDAYTQWPDGFEPKLSGAQRRTWWRKLFGG